MMSSCQQYSRLVHEFHTEVISRIDLNHLDVPLLPCLTNGFDFDNFWEISAQRKGKIVNLREQQVIQVVTKQELLEHVFGEVGGLRQNLLKW